MRQDDMAEFISASYCLCDVKSPLRAVDFRLLARFVFFFHQFSVYMQMRTFTFCISML